MRPSFFSAALLLAACSGSSTSAAVSPSAAARVCAFGISCAPAGTSTSPGSECAANLVATSFGDYFYGDPHTLPHELGCAMSASDCATLQTCRSDGHGPTYCAAHPGTSCDGDLRVSCDSATSQASVDDCASFGAHCMVAAGAALCTDGVACDPATSPAHCDGDFLVACPSAASVEVRIDCRRYLPGGACAHDEGGGGMATLCVPDGAPCDRLTFVARCDGNVAVTCPYGRELRRDCASAESTCHSDSTLDATCVPIAGDCSDGSDDRCAGDSLEICVNGHYVATPCADLGMRTCASTSSGERCVP